MKQFLMDGRNSRADGEVVKDAVFLDGRIFAQIIDLFMME